jgi:hypothetical protein
MDGGEEKGAGCHGKDEGCADDFSQVSYPFDRAVCSIAFSA